MDPLEIPPRKTKNEWDWGSGWGLVIVIFGTFVVLGGVVGLVTYLDAQDPYSYSFKVGYIRGWNFVKVRDLYDVMPQIDLGAWSGNSSTKHFTGFMKGVTDAKDGKPPLFIMDGDYIKTVKLKESADDR